MNTYRLETKKDYEEALYKIINPLKKYYDKDTPGRIKLGESGSVYRESTRQIEGFLRTLWGIGPLFSYKEDDEWFEFVKEGIVEGTDPNSQNYWGEPTDFDQLIVEMAALATTLLINQELLWKTMSPLEKDNLYNWLNIVNQRDFSQNNWLFFRVLVNVWFKKSNQKWDEKRVEEDLAKIDSFYIGNGWYYDGRPTQVDYYISFAIHYYSLIYCKFMADDDPIRVTLFKNRATQFAQTFKTWFDDRGEAIPFGRSLTYRFAQSAFWSALAFANVEAIPWGEVKWLLGKNLERWFSYPIFSRQGRLTIGYHYENLVMAEGYNAPGSPYWGLKSFLILAVPDSHPIWSAEMKKPAYDTPRTLIPEANMLMVRGDSNLQLFPAGRMEHYQAHSEAKYGKLVYSTVFGFSVSKSGNLYHQGGFDNSFVVSEDDTYYRTPFKVEEYLTTEKEVLTIWHPFRDVKVSTRIIPINDLWHIRIHDIQTDRALVVRDGGFSVPYEKNEEVKEFQGGILFKSLIGKTQMIPLQGYQESELTIAEPNTNLFFELSAYPSLKSNLEIGEHQLISLVGGIPQERKKEKIIPEIAIKENQLEVQYENQVLSILLNR